MKRFLFSLLTAALTFSPSAFGASSYVADRAITEVKLNGNTFSMGTIRNLGLSASVATNALTVAIKQADGTTNASATGPVDAAYRSATATTGSSTLVSVTGALSIVVPSSATLGQASSMNQYVWVYLMNDAGTADVCVSGVSVFNNGTPNSSTQITSGATSGSTLYCASSHTGAKGTVLVGRLLVNETTAGTWASAPTEVAVNVAPVYNATSWAAFTPGTQGFGTITLTDCKWRRDAQDILEVCYFRIGTSTSVEARVNFPNSLVSDATANSHLQMVGFAGNCCTTSAAQFGQDTVLLDATSVGYFTFGQASSTTSAFQKTNGSVIGASGTDFSFSARAPILGWSAFGP